MPTLPNLSALSLEAHDADATGVSGDQCDPTKSRKSSSRCVRMRLHPNVFAAVRNHPEYDPKKYDADSTSICFLAPTTATDGRYTQRSIEDVLYESRPWKTFYNHYLREHPTKSLRWGDGPFFSWEHTIKINPGFYGDVGWQILPDSLRTKSWYTLVEGLKIMRQVPKQELHGRYEPGLFLELCMEPDWALAANPTETFQFIKALWYYNVDHFPYWITKYAEEKEAAKRQRTNQAGASTSGASTSGASTSGGSGESARSRGKLTKRQAEDRWMNRGAQAPAPVPPEEPPLKVWAEPVPAPAPAPAPTQPELPPQSDIDKWLKEIANLAPLAPAPARPVAPADLRDDKAIMEQWARNQNNRYSIAPLPDLPELPEPGSELDDALRAELGIDED